MPRRGLMLTLVAWVGVACAPAMPAPDVATPAAAEALADSRLPRPAEVIGFEPGDDYVLADYGQLLEYYERLASASDRVELVEIGRSTQDRPMVLMFISDPENLAQLERWRETSERLARAEGLADQEARELAREGKVIVWIDAGLHSTEVATAQHVPHLAYHMAADESEETRRIRRDVILLLMPVMNPDGHEIVVDWYRANLGTDHETTRPPRVYHEYVGHDINRDWYMFRQDETRVVGRILYEEWFPQIVFNHHQTAPFPARIFIPPFADPVNPHIDPRVVRGVNLVGDHMANRFEMEAMPGVVSGMAFTMWWNGGMRTAPYFHNQIGILSEVGHASPTPREHDPADLPETFGSAGGSIPTLEPTVFYPNPWRGGRASIGEAVRYHLVASLGTLDVAQKNREDFLYTFYLMGRDAIQAGESGDPFAYVVALPDQHDPGEALELLTALRRGGIRVERSTSSFEAGGRSYPEGTYVLPAAQAFRAHLLDLMEPHEHPHREIYPGGPPEPPYGGLAGYTLPIQMGVSAVRIDEPFAVETEPLDRIPVPSARIAGTGDTWLIPTTENRVATAFQRLLAGGFEPRRSVEPVEADGIKFPAGTLILETDAAGSTQVEAIVSDAGVRARRTATAPTIRSNEVRASRIALYQPWTGNMDEGWTRWLLGHYGIPYRALTDQDIRAGRLEDVDVILFAAQGARSILRGHPPDRMPEPYTGGLGDEGADQLARFARAGGRLVALDEATDFLIYEFDLPVSNALAGLELQAFFIPGSLIRIDVDTAHPVAFGMPAEAAAFFQGSRAFEVIEPGPEIAARYALNDLLMSGWEVGADEYLAGRAAVVRVPFGEGDMVLIGFRPQFRAQPAGTFKLLFNALGAMGLERR